MAYAYQAINDLMGQQNQNIFATDPSQQQGQTNPNAQQGAVKTSTEGQIAGNNNSSSTQQASNAPSASAQGSDTGQADRSAVQANAGKVAQPTAISGIQSQLTSANQNLQDQANQYVTGAEAKQNYKVDNSNIDQAINGDQTQAAAVRSLINQQAPTPIDTFTLPDTNVKDVSLLKTGAGLQNLVARGQDPNYNAGMAAFDAQSLRKSPEFMKSIQDLQNQQQALNTQATTLQTQKQQEVQNYGQAQLTAAQAAARDYLTGQSSQITSAEQQAADAANRQLAQYRTQGVGDAQTQALAQARQAAINQLNEVNPRAVGLVNGVNVDPGQYLNIHGDYGANDFVTGDQASRYNGIMGLLGQGGFQTQSLPQEAAYTINQNALQQAILGGANAARTQQDTQLQAQIAAMQAQAQQKAAAFNAQEGDPARQAAQQQAAQIAQGLGVNPGQLVDYNKFLQMSAPITGAQTYSQGDVNTLNDLYKQLGNQTVVQYNQAKNPYTFDQNGYTSALQQAINAQHALTANQGQVAQANNAGQINANAADGGLLTPSGIYLKPTQKQYVQDQTNNSGNAGSLAFPLLSQMVQR